MKPSFHTLFRRRELDSQSSKEVFAVAAIAFCLKHDEDFAAKFLREFCGVSFQGPISSLIVDADTHKWADLMIRSDVNSFACVLEFKIESDVNAHQNPNCPEFGGNKGYGRLMSESLECRDHKTKRFVVVTGEKERETIQPDQKLQHGINCDWKSWAELSLIRPAKSVTTDLFDSLGDLGIEDFREISLRKMKLQKSAFGTLKVVQTLDHVHRALGNRPLRIAQIEDEDKSNDHWWTGVGVQGKDSLQREGWFGYEGRKNLENATVPEEGHAAVWFYFYSDSLKREADRKLLLEHNF